MVRSYKAFYRTLLNLFVYTYCNLQFTVRKYESFNKSLNQYPGSYFHSPSLPLGTSLPIYCTIQFFEYDCHSGVCNCFHVTQSCTVAKKMAACTLYHNPLRTEQLTLIHLDHEHFSDMSKRRQCSFMVFQHCCVPSSALA